LSILIPDEIIGESHHEWRKRMRRRGLILACGAVSVALVIGSLIIYFVEVKMAHKNCNRYKAIWFIFGVAAPVFYFILAACGVFK